MSFGNVFIPPTKSTGGGTNYGRISFTFTAQRHNDVNPYVRNFGNCQKLKIQTYAIMSSNNKKHMRKEKQRNIYKKKKSISKNQYKKYFYLYYLYIYTMYVTAVRIG